jgi:hypothetical protein
MKRHATRRQTRGQALVEFAFISILVVIILGMAIDGGLIYLTYQNMVNSVEEGLSYGTYEPLVRGSGGSLVANDEAIRFRMRHEGGDRDTDGGIRFINMFDLDNNGTFDDLEGGYGGGVLASHMLISAHADSSGTTPCATRAQNCWLRIEMIYDYQTKFPIVPVLERTLEIHAVRFQQISRSILID